MSTELYAISNSEVMSWASCQRKWMYEFGMRLAPSQVSEALYNGIIFHEVMDIYYKTLIGMAEAGETVHHPTAKANAMAMLNSMITESLENKDDDTMRRLFVVSKWCELYFDVAPQLPWEIIASEERVGASYGDIEAAGRFDLLVRMTDGPHKGKLVIVDHKTTWQRWSDAEKEMNGAMYKYAAWLKASKDIHVSVGIYNFIMSRTNDVSKMFFQDYVDLPVAKQEAAVQDHITYAIQIYKAKDEFLNGDFRDTAPRCWNKMTCKMCSFKALCIAEIGGRRPATELMIKTSFRDNDYGYRLGSEQ